MLKDFYDLCVGEGYPLYLALVMIFYMWVDARLGMDQKQLSEIRRWTRNLGLYLTNNIVAFGLLVILGFQVELRVDEFRGGLFRDFPFIIQLLTYALVFDFFTYWLHRLMHAWQPLWRLHLVHHSDPELDFSDSLRFHPLERLTDIPLIMASAWIVGADLEVLLAYTFFYTLFVFFPHSNVVIPERINSALKLIIVTAEMHRVHHSSVVSQTNSNYGDLFSFWDRLFGTYTQVPQSELRTMQIGLEYFRQDPEQSFLMLLAQPFVYRDSLRSGSDSEAAEH